MCIFFFFGHKANKDGSMKGNDEYFVFGWNDEVKRKGKEREGKESDCVFMRG